jgi:hypothetical protein
MIGTKLITNNHIIKEVGHSIGPLIKIDVFGPSSGHHPVMIDGGRPLFGGLLRRHISVTVGRGRLRGLSMLLLQILRGVEIACVIKLTFKHIRVHVDLA